MISWCYSLKKVLQHDLNMDWWLLFLVMQDRRTSVNLFWRKCKPLFHVFMSSGTISLVTISLLYLKLIRLGRFRSGSHQLNPCFSCFCFGRHDECEVPKVVMIPKSGLWCDETLKIQNKHGTSWNLMTLSFCSLENRSNWNLFLRPHSALFFWPKPFWISQEDFPEDFP